MALAVVTCFVNPVLHPLQTNGYRFTLSVHTCTISKYASRSSVKAVLYQAQSQSNGSNLLSPVLILPGLGNSYTDYSQLAMRLAERGHVAVAVAPIQRWQWVINVKGFFTLDYWRCTLRPDQVLGWYFEKADKAVEEIASALSEQVPLTILGHSAGGWLGRAFIADRTETKDLSFRALITLGTPNRSPPDGKLDQTRGLLSYIEQNCDVSDIVSDFVCVAGTGTVGKQLGRGSLEEYIAFLSYGAVCGEGGVDGDGVTPLNAACAKKGTLVVCNNCDHSMLTSKNWYGSDAAFAEWIKYLP